MPKPENINHPLFEVQLVLLNEGNFSIASGHWRGHGARTCLAMRWNDCVSSKGGYPAYQWFTLPSWLSRKLLTSVHEHIEAQLTLRAKELLGMIEPATSQTDALHPQPSSPADDPPTLTKKLRDT